VASPMKRLIESPARCQNLLTWGPGANVMINHNFLWLAPIFGENNISFSYKPLY
jgi:hypothetical protein